jgi:hypothetical protein
LFTRQVRKQLTQNIEIVSERLEKKNSPAWRVSLYFYLPNMNFTRIWRVGELLSAPVIQIYSFYTLRLVLESETPIVFLIVLGVMKVQGQRLVIAYDITLRRLRTIALKKERKNKR